MINEIRNNIMADLSEDFNADQLKQIDLTIAKAFQGYQITKQETLPAASGNIKPMEVREFIARKRVKGCSEGTIRQYELAMESFIQWAKKDLKDMTDLDIMIYLDYLKTSRHISNRTLDGNRLILSSFYSFMQDSGKITKNPMASIDPIKYTAKVREPLTDMEMEQVRDACITLKERALIEVLYSTGGRVSEIVGMNWTDIDMKNRRAVITGKGDKQRFVFFNAKSLFAIQKYLNSRNDDNVALFVKDNYPHSRLTKSGIEYIVRKIGQCSGIGRPLYPHLFRHTFATDMLTNGAPIDEASKILGHEKIETTQIYAKSSTDMLALSHKLHIA